MRSANRFFVVLAAIGAGLAFASAPAAAQANLPIEIVPGIGHKGIVDSVAFSPDRGIIVSGSRDETIKLWDASSGQVIRTIPGHRDSVAAVAFLPDGRTIVSGSRDNTIKLWDAASGRELRTLRGHGDEVHAVAVSPDGRRIVSASIDGQIKLWDVASGQELRTLVVGGGLSDVAFLPDGRRIVAVTNVSADGNGIIRLWESASGDKLSTSTVTHIEPHGITVSPDGRTIAFGRLDLNRDTASVVLWDVASARELRTFTANVDDRVYAVAFSPDGRTIASGSANGALQLWDVSSGRELRAFSGHKAEIMAVAFSRDGSTIASASADTSLKLWDAATGRELRTLTGQGDAVSHMAVSQDGRLMVGSSAKALTFWDTVSGRAGHILLEPTRRVALSPDGRTLIAISKDGMTLSIWNVESTRKERAIIVSSDVNKPVWDIAFAPNGRTIATADRYTVKLWDVASGRQLRTLNADAERISADRVVFSPDGSAIAAGGASSLALWDAEGGRLLVRDRRVNEWISDLAFFPDGRTIVSGENNRDGKLRLWDRRTARVLRTLNGNASIALAVSPDGRTILGSSYDKTLKLWEVASGQEIRSLTGYASNIYNVAFSPDGQTIFAASAAIYRWTVAGEFLATHISDGEEWLTITAEGFFDSSGKGAGLLSAVRGFEIFSIDQFYQALYRPDLVREKLAGDPRGLVREAAAKLDLGKVLASGPAPTVAIVTPRDGDRPSTVQVQAAVDVTNSGGGIGRVEWRVNGVTVGVETPTPVTGAPLRLTRGLSLDAGDNVIEVIAYNGQNLVASSPARATIVGPAQAAPTASRLFVLAVGLNDYADPNIKLNLAVPDAQTLAEALKQAGKGLYGSVEVTLLRDAEVRRERLDAAFTTLAGKVQPSDVFVFFLAGHGKTIDGRYYFMPQNSSLESVRAIMGTDAANPQKRARAEAELRKVVVEQGIAQEQWQAWFATIPARKSLMLFDTCESGSLIEDSKETLLLERDAASGRLAQATGRTILTAASNDQEANEGYRGHGLFTYNVLEALERADSDHNGTIEVAELAAYVYAEVSALSEQVFQSRQVPQVRIAGNYPLVNQAAVLGGAAPGMTIATKPTHLLSAASELLIQPAFGAISVRKLDANTAVTLVKNEGGWTLVAREGRPIGYVAAGGLAPMQ